MDLHIAGETALVLGGTQGLGLACASALAGAGVTVVLNGRDAAKGEKAAESLGAAARFVPGDLGQPEARAPIYSDTVAAAGAPSILVTNAGVDALSRAVDFVHMVSES